MNIQDIYKKNKTNFLFSKEIEVENYRKELLLNFINNKYDKKNNESLKNVNLKNFFDFDYKYNESEEPSLIKKNQDNNYVIKIVNGKCDSFNDENRCCWGST